MLRRTMCLREHLARQLLGDAVGPLRRNRLARQHVFPRDWHVMIYPALCDWQVMAPAAVPRNYHSIGLLLPDARVFNGGGGLGGANCGCVIACSERAVTVLRHA